MPRTRNQTALEPPLSDTEGHSTGDTRNHTPGPEQSVTSSTLSPAPSELDDTDRLIQATRQRIQQLQELAELRKKEEELLQSLGGRIPRDKPSRTRRNSDDSNSSSGKEVRVRNIVKLNLPITFQQRDAWLSDLTRAFMGAKRKYRKDYRKILLAIDHMDGEARRRWDRYLDELPGNERENTKENWEAFKEWSLLLIKDSVNREPLLMKQLENAAQRETQSPQDFHQYLDSLEKNFPRAAERQRALTFYAKLLPMLQDHISLHSPEIPDTREGVVTLATRFWDSMRGRTEADAISQRFAIQQGLKPAKVIRPDFAAAGSMPLEVLGMWEVPVKLTDVRGRTKEVTRICIGIDMESNPRGTPLILSESTLVDLRIITDHATKKWWFRQDWSQSQILTPQRFHREHRNKAKVFAITGLEDAVIIPGDDEGNDLSVSEVPEEFRDFIDVFSAEKASSIPEHKGTDHRIDLIPDKTPPYGPIYPLSQSELGELRQYLDDNLATGRIRPSKSPAGAPILFVPKKDGTLRLCVDYRGLNGVSIKNRYPLPLVTEILDRIQGATYFTKIDVKDAYHRIRIAEGDEWKTAFRTRYGHFEYVVMPFGLTNAPATFQHYIHQALRGLVDTICIVYLDDILIYSKNREEHTQHVKEVLKRMRAAELYAKPSKCSFFQDQVEYLGYILSAKGIAMDPARVETIRQWKEPGTFREVQVFLGFCNFYRRFIEGYSRIAQPLTALMQGSKNGKKPGGVTLFESERKAFRDLIEAFQRAPLLIHFDPGKQIRIETDASAFAMAGILSQQDEQGKWHPVAFWSRKFKKEELSYGAPDHELFAIVESFKHWRHYLEGALHKIEVLSDHLNLQAFMKTPKLNGRQARWCLYLTPYDFIIKHRPGKTNPADPPSRRPEYEGETPEYQELLPGLESKLAQVQAITRAQWNIPGKPREGTVNTTKPRGETLDPGEWDKWSQEKLNHPRSHTRDAVRQGLSGESVYTEQVTGSLLDMIGGLQQADTDTQERIIAITTEELPRKNLEWTVGTDGLLRFKNRLFIPKDPALRAELMRLYHDDPLAGHFGVNRTLQLLQRKVHWTSIEDDVREYIQTCAVCQSAATPRHRPYGRLESLPIPRRPMVELTMDFITGLPPIWLNDKYVDAILVIVDRFTKYSIFLPVSTEIDASGLATLFHQEVELLYGAPEGIVSDRGPVFTSGFWSALCYHSRIKRRLSTAFHPQTDGQTERMNQVLEHYLRCFIGENQANWPALLRTAQFACNNAVSNTTGISPFNALLGYEPDFHFRHEGMAPGGEVPEVTLRIEKIRMLRERAMIQWREATESQAKHFNAKHQEKTFQAGDLIALSTKNIKLKGEKKKLAPRFLGPFRILERVGKQAYRLALPDKYQLLHNVFHVSLLEPWRKRQGDQGNTLPMPDLEEEEGEWEIESVTARKKIQGDIYFLVKWKGWPHEYDQWVPSEDMGNAARMIEEFEKRNTKQQEKSQPKVTKPRGRPKKSQQ
ncbi:hypothetical protein FAUST_9880 [Fusarium austroamericanum]|uniref:Reverse transcriptase n=1 Tax=Fusarium austroamericanum TaxID=282268 RepID=A0AAN5Z2W7_FUSAU|nr:hypothetical protein FAUST_9880 [Fusarium austroamericanum]